MTTTTTTVPRVGTKAHAALVRRYRRAWLACCAAEERAADERTAWALAQRSDLACWALREVEAGRAPVRPAPRTARNLARGGLAALAALGAVVARAVARAEALARGRATQAARRAARTAARTARAALRRALRAVVRLVPLARPLRCARHAALAALGWSVPACHHHHQEPRTMTTTHSNYLTNVPAPPALLNGSPVRLAEQIGNTWVVLVEHYGYQPWVVASWYPSSSGTGWDNGHYHETEDDARATFRRVVLEREVVRSHWLARR